MNSLIYIFFALLLFQLYDSGFAVDKIATISATSTTKTTIKASTVVQMVICQLDFYYKSPKPPREWKDKSEKRDFYMEPHFAYANFMQNCMENHSHPEFNEVKKLLFVDINKWIDKGKAYLEKEYDEIDNKISRKEQFNLWRLLCWPWSDESDKVVDVKTLKHWRRMLMPYGLAIGIVHLKFGHALLDKLLDKSNVEFVTDTNYKHFRWVFEMLGNELENNLAILKLSFLSKINKKFTEQFWPIYEKLESVMDDNINIEIDLNKDNTKATTPIELPMLTFPRVKRVFWVVRHGQREDNIRDKKHKGKPMTIAGRTFEGDNSPLSARGKEMASRVAKVFQHIPISHIFASPFERTVDSAHRLLAKNHEGLEIKLEPGFLESLPSAKQLSFQESAAVLQREGKYERLDLNYRPAVSKMQLKECGRHETSDDDGSLPRVEATMEALFGKIPNATTATSEIVEHSSSSTPCSPNNLRQWINPKFEPAQISNLNAEYDQSRRKLEQELSDGKKQSKWLAPGEELAEHIVISTHATVGVSLQYLATGKFSYVPQSSISKFVQIDDESETSSDDEIRPAGEGRLFDNIRMIYGSDVGHLVEREKALFEH